MREIKFRAWHLGAASFNKPAQMLYDEKSGDCLRWKADSQNIQDVMQFTGLTEFNGKDIYEGDIITLDGIPQGPFVIAWNQRGASWCLLYLDTWYDDLSGWDGEIKIIGNIYENPELLETRA